MEKFIADFMSLSYGERVFLSATTVYMVVTAIWALRIIYREKKKSWLEEKRKKKRSMEKVLKLK